MSLFEDFSIEGSALVARETGARIPLTFDSARDAMRIASFVGVVGGLRASRLLRGRSARARIAFYPRKPMPYYAIWPVCQLADVKIVDDPAEADIAFYFEDVEYRAAPPAPPAPLAFNAGCVDIRKSRVAAAFEAVFGYGLAVDPRTHQGPAVEKSEENGKHDGRIVVCPIDRPRTDRVYQRLVDNTFDGEEFIDIRTPCVDGRIPFVYLKRRTRAERFSNENHRVDLVDADVMLTAAEQADIARFAAMMGLDFGGLDVLRDRSDGRIYIVDVNKTDMGPPSALSGKGKLAAMRLLADAFGDLVDRRLAARAPAMV